MIDVKHWPTVDRAAEILNVEPADIIQHVGAKALEGTSIHPLAVIRIGHWETKKRSINDIAGDLIAVAREAGDDDGFVEASMNDYFALGSVPPMSQEGFERYLETFRHIGMPQEMIDEFTQAYEDGEM